MSIIAVAVKHLIAAGVSGDDLLKAIAEMELEISGAELSKARSAGAIRTERWRARKADEASQKASQGVTNVTSDECDGCDVDPSLSLPPNEEISNPPTHTHPDMTTRARKADPFPCPDWCPKPLWSDLKENRRKKRLANTATAHAKLIHDIDALVDDEWPPGRLLEAIVARGWGAAYDPRENPRHEANGTSNGNRSSANQRGPTRGRGERDNRDGFTRAIDDAGGFHEH